MILCFLITATSGSRAPNPNIWFYVFEQHQTQGGNAGEE